uniref:Uncharacterized protein n=1 Tax=Mimivirus LCMiAC02 TaxID=2506609 RepID=A0A481Z111_9VIRU|nr:MAG: hypothetical protein LCMiAC02_02880 [Mimivirus LCMiAC02]
MDKWADSIGKKIIESVSFSIGNVVCSKQDGNGNAITEHIGIHENECLVCKHYKPIYSASDMQYFYGTTHKYINEHKKYNCYIGKQIINSLYEEWMNLWTELRKE